MLLHGLRQQDYRGRVALSTSTYRDAKFFEQNHVDVVLIPYADAAKEAADRLFSYINDSSSGEAG
jgi:hypothetical protein